MQQLNELLPEVLQNQVPAKQELQLQKIGDSEMQLAEAVKEMKIINSPVESLKEVLRLAMVKVGLRAANWPNEEEKAVLIHLIVSNYGNHTAKEIKLAFDMAIAGKLDDYLQENESVICYENFSCLYFSSIINAYRKWAAEAHKHAVKEPLPAIEHKEDMSDKAMSDWFDQTAQGVKENTLKIDFIPLMLYDWLIKQSRINPSGAEKRGYLQKAVEFTHGRLAAKIDDKESSKELSEFNAMKESGEFTGKWITVLPDLAKRMIVWDYILKTEQ